MIKYSKEMNLNKGSVILDFQGTDCPACKMLSRQLENIESKYNNMQFISVDVYNDTPIANNYHILGIPTLVVLKDGEEIDRRVGTRNDAETNDFFNTACEKCCNS